MSLLSDSAVEVTVVPVVLVLVLILLFVIMFIVCIILNPVLQLSVVLFSVLLVFVIVSHHITLLHSVLCAQLPFFLFLFSDTKIPGKCEEDCRVMTCKIVKNCCFSKLVST